LLSLILFYARDKPMSENTLKFIAILAMISVAVVLIRGLKTFFKGGDLDSKRKSNKLMQMRIMLQFCAIVILMSLAYVTGK
jgi:predicted nucleic acid-binding Zn ribbon protein|tara:strand:- start:14690 stop:14932 length:243 start_codon:yes stop_codon:yes gene_type:complete